MFTLGSLLFGKNGLSITFIVFLLFAIPTFIPIETTTNEINSIQIKTETSETVDMIEKMNSVESSITGRRLSTTNSGSSKSTGVSYNTLKEKIETVKISETVETLQTPNQFVLGIIFKILYAFTAPFCWLMMYFVMKRKEEKI